MKYLLILYIITGSGDVELIHKQTVDSDKCHVVLQKWVKSRPERRSGTTAKTVVYHWGACL